MRHYYKSILIAILILFLSVFNFNALDTEEIPLIPHADKIVHFFMYFSFALFLLGDLRKAQVIKQFFLVGIVITVVYGFLMELIQLVFTSYRSFEIADFIVNTLGVLSGYFAYKLLLKTKQTFF